MSDPNLPGSRAVQDPSMEEVLASIRRILSDEQGGSRFVQESEGELLLDSSMLLSMQSVPVNEPTVKIVFPLSESNISSEFEKNNGEIEQPQYVEGFAEQQYGSQHFDSIGFLAQKGDMDPKIAIDRSGITLEDMVRESLEPMLKSWLDENLPALVERVVSAKTDHL